MLAWNTLLCRKNKKSCKHLSCSYFIWFRLWKDSTSMDVLVHMYAFRELHYLYITKPRSSHANDHDSWIEGKIPWKGLLVEACVRLVSLWSQAATLIWFCTQFNASVALSVGLCRCLLIITTRRFALIGNLLTQIYSCHLDIHQIGGFVTFVLFRQS